MIKADYRCQKIIKELNSLRMDENDNDTIVVQNANKGFVNLLIDTMIAQNLTVQQLDYANFIGSSAEFKYKLHAEKVKDKDVVVIVLPPKKVIGKEAMPLAIFGTIDYPILNAIGHLIDKNQGRKYLLISQDQGTIKMIKQAVSKRYLE